MDNIRKRLSQRLGALAALVLLTAPGLAAQTGAIAGRVLDSGSNTPIPAAQVFIADLDIGVLSQQNGSYILQNVPAGPRTVTVQRIGYRQITQTVTVAAGQTAVLDFRISEEALALDEIIVTGTPGGTARRAIGNTVATVGASQVTQDVAISGMQDLLAGRTPGLQYTVMNGTVGTGSPVRIRGVSSFTLGQNPIIIVDGVRVNNSTSAGPTIGSGDEVNTLDDFNPEDIESIEIIKGPAAASLYGTEATAGVIQIITKKGREGAPEFNISVRQGINYLRDPAGRLGTMYFCPTQPSPSQSVGVPCTSRDQLEPYNMYDEANNYFAAGWGKGVWPTDNLYSNGPSQSYNLDVRGGTQAVRYFLSANYDNEQGYVWYNDDQTFRLRGNVGIAFGDMLNLDVTTGYVNGYTTFGSAAVSDGAEWQDLVWSNGYYLDRNATFGTTGNCPSGAQTGCGPNPRLGGFQDHLPADIAEVEATREYTRFTGSVSLNFNTGDFDLGGMTGSLTQRLVTGIDKGWDINRNVYTREDGIVPQWAIDYCSSPTRPAGAPASCAPTVWTAEYTQTALGEMSYERPISTNLSFDYALTASLRPNDIWTFNSSFGAQYYVRQRDEFRNTGQGFAAFTSSTINHISQAAISTFYEFEENKALGFYVQEEINYADRIFLTGAIRFDDNSTFGENAPATKYPKLSATWVVSDESFWTVEAINSLRLRGAWGKAGRQPSALAQFNQYAVVPGAGGAPAIRASAPGNTGVEPEVSTELEAGFDIALLEDRLSGEFTYFTRQNRQSLLGIANLSSTGLPGSVDTNVGRMDNWGWEAQLSARLFESDIVAIDLDLAADYTNNEIKSLCDSSSGQEVCFSGNDNVRIGYPYPNITVADLVVDAGFDQTLVPCTAALFAAGTRCQWGQNAFGQRLWAYCDVGVTSAPGGETDPNVGRYSRFPGGALEQCGNAVDKQLYAGRGFATHTFSAGPRFTFLEGDLQVFGLIEGQYGRTMIDSGHLWGHNYRNSAVSRVQDDPWWVAYDIAVGTGCAWDKCLFDADFWKLREIGARYNLPQSLIGVTGASRASLAFSARNLMTIWQAQKRIYGQVITDPEMGNPNNIAGGGNFYAQPPMTSLNLTLRVTF